MKTRNRTLINMVAASGMLVVAADGHALPVIDFGMVAPTPGTVTYAGGVAPLMGTNIEADNVVGLSTPLHDSVLSNCVACVINFTTGNLSGYNAATSTWTFNGGGNIQIVGGVDFSDNTTLNDIASGSTLLSGTFNNASVIKLPTGYFQFFIAGGSFTDSKHPDLLAYYGLPANVPYEGGFNLSFAAAPGGGPGGFSSTMLLSGDVSNTPVPLPGALWLLGSGLAGIGAFARRRK